MINIEQKEIWFVTGSQHLYGEETLKQVAANSRQIVEGLKNSSHIPVRVICQDTVKTSDEIAALFLRANARSEEHTSELQSRPHLVCRLLLEKKKKKKNNRKTHNKKKKNKYKYSAPQKSIDQDIIKCTISENHSKCTADEKSTQYTYR